MFVRCKFGLGNKLTTLFSFRFGVDTKMSCQLNVLAHIQDVRAVKQYLFPDQNEETEKEGFINAFLAIIAIKLCVMCSN